MFYGIVIRMYFYDNKQHHTPHIHAEYAGEQAVFSINDGEILAGSLHLEKLDWYRPGLKYIARN